METPPDEKCASVADYACILKFFGNAAGGITGMQQDKFLP